MHNRCRWVAAFIFLASGLCFAQANHAEAETGASLYAGLFRSKPSGFSDALWAESLLETGPFFIKGAFTYLNDGKYPAHSSYELNHYFTLGECLLGFANDRIELTGGRMRIEDEVDSPYALFFSPSAEPSLGVAVSLDADPFAYSTRWIMLNANSDIRYEGTDQYILDRGMNYKKFAFDFGRLEIGYQDVSVYLFEAFDAESFFNPLPSLIQQLVVSASGRPGSRHVNPNDLMGFFAKYGTEDWDFEGQILVDDLNASFLSPVLGWLIPSLESIRNVTKLAWNVGCSYRTGIGEFRFFHGGATKYCFEPTYSSAIGPEVGDSIAIGPDYSTFPYGYTYYPISRYSYGGSERTIALSDNYIGFQYGENALAFQVAYSNGFFKGTDYSFELESSIEYAINGSKSPANPWHEFDSWLEVGKPIVLFDETVLEHSLVLGVDCEKKYRSWNFYVHGELGYIWNKLEPDESRTPAGEAVIWRPMAGNGSAIAGISLGCGYYFDF